VDVPVVGAPLQHEEWVGTHGFCDLGTSDVDGTRIALPVGDSSSSGIGWSLFDPQTGTSVGSFDATRLFGLGFDGRRVLSGHRRFQGGRRDTALRDSFVTWDLGGGIVAESRIKVAAMALDPKGGAAVLVAVQPYGDYRLGIDLQRFDADGHSLHQAVPIARPVGNHSIIVAKVGVTATGAAVAVYDGSDVLAEGVLVGQWFDRTGRSMTAPFEVARGFDFSPYAQPRVDLHLSPLTDSILAVRIDGKWRATLHATEPRASLAPNWLVERPDTALYPVRNGRAFASTPFAEYVSRCREQQLEIISPTGQTCGRVKFPGSVLVNESTCRWPELSVGADGTVFQLETLSPGGQGVTCRWRWWPALLH
jgi:hypothetical protein